MGGWIKVEIKHSGHCRECGTFIDEGDTAFWSPDNGIMCHPKCETEVKQDVTELRIIDPDEDYLSK